VWKAFMNKAISIRGYDEFFGIGVGEEGLFIGTVPRDYV